MRRVWVVGTSGSGKTTLARELAERLDVPHTELDALHWGPGWTPRHVDVFLGDVTQAVSGSAWVIDGNYASRGAAELVRRHADTLVWVDPPRSTVIRRVAARSVRRIVTGEELWSGNRETWSSLFARDSVVRWAWTTYARNHDRYAAAQSDPAFGHLTHHRIRDYKERDALLALALDSRRGSRPDPARRHT